MEKCKSRRDGSIIKDIEIANKSHKDQSGNQAHPTVIAGCKHCQLNMHLNQLSLSFDSAVHHLISFRYSTS